MEHLEKLTKDYFNQGLTVDDYLEELRHYRSLVRKLMEAVASSDSPSPADVESLRAVVDGFTQPVRATVNTEDWCGDWICNLPILKKLFEKVEIPLRVFRGSEFPQLKKHYEKDGDTHIPAVSLWDGDGNELLRWIEAPAKVAEQKDAWKAENPRMMELYQKQSEDKQAAKEFAKLYRSFLETMAGWYTSGMWHETVAELLQKAQQAAHKNAQ
ncbi:MAG: thioredoxin family protein [bacterium]